MLEDVAFLFMDLEYRGRFDLSAAVSDAYFSHFPESRSVDLLLFYKIYRAVVRGKIEGFTADGLKGDRAGREAAIGRAGNYYGLAQYYVEHARSPFNPVVLMGPAGSGKSAIAEGLLPGASVLRSDEVRKRLAGVPAAAHVYVDYGSGLYDPAMTQETYRAMTQEAVAAAAKGKRVVVDATFLTSRAQAGVLRELRKGGSEPVFHLVQRGRAYPGRQGGAPDGKWDGRLRRPPSRPRPAAPDQGRTGRPAFFSCHEAGHGG